MAQPQYQIERYVPSYRPPPFCGSSEPALTLTLRRIMEGIRRDDIRTTTTHGSNPLEVIVSAIRELTGQQFAVEEVKTHIEREEPLAVLKTPPDASHIHS